MSGTRYTPGPWVWQNGCSWWRLGRYHDGDVMRPEVMKDGWPTLSFPNTGIYGPDFHLIASAPDLLEALEALRTWALDYAQLCGPLPSEIIADAEHAIAKSKGRET